MLTRLGGYASASDFFVGISEKNDVRIWLEVSLCVKQKR